MRDAYTDYVKQVGRRMHCSRTEKKQLLNGLKAELTDVSSELGDLSLVEISTQFGTPKDMAAELQTALPIEEQERYLMRQRWCMRLGIVTLILVIALLVGYFWWASNFDKHYIVETKIGIIESQQID